MTAAHNSWPVRQPRVRTEEQKRRHAQQMRERYHRLDRPERVAQQQRALEADCINSLSDLDLAYIAGLFDGESSVSIIRHPTRLGPEIRVNMTSKPVLEWVAVKIGTGVGRTTREHEQRKTIYYIVISGRRAILLANRLLPFLKVKGPQAAVLVAFGRTYGQMNGSSLMDEARRERERLVQAMRELNRRGPVRLRTLAEGELPTPPPEAV